MPAVQHLSSIMHTKEHITHTTLTFDLRRCCQDTSVYAKFHRAKCSGSSVMVLTEKILTTMLKTILPSPPRAVNIEEPVHGAETVKWWMMTTETNRRLSAGADRTVRCRGPYSTGGRPRVDDVDSRTSASDQSETTVDGCCTTTGSWLLVQRHQQRHHNQRRRCLRAAADAADSAARRTLLSRTAWNRPRPSPPPVTSCTCIDTQTHTHLAVITSGV